MREVAYRSSLWHQTYYQVVDRLVNLCTGLAHPDICVIAIGHHSRINLLLLVLLQKPGQEVAEPVRLFDMAEILIYDARGCKRIPSMSLQPM